VITMADRRRRRTANPRRDGVANRRPAVGEQTANGGVGKTLIPQAAVEAFDGVGEIGSVQCAQSTERVFRDRIGHETPAQKS